MERRVESIKDYLDWIKLAGEGECITKNLTSSFFYRGQANSQWGIVPNIFRENKIYNEQQLLFSANNYLSSQLSNCKDELEKMILLQHYGLKTRLLDVTRNPLVALYFACQNNETDGTVYCGFFSYDYNSQKVARLIAKLVFDREYPNDFNDYALLYFSKSCDYTSNVEIIKQDLANPCFFIPQYNNKRILAQQGAFIMAPFYQNDYGYFQRLINIDYKDKKYNIFTSSINIKADKKESILDELDGLGINQATIFPNIEHIVEYINNFKTQSNFKVYY